MKLQILLFVSILFITSSIAFAQENKQKGGDNSKVSTINGTDGIQTYGDKVSIKDGATTLIEVTNEGLAGSITLPSVGNSLSGTKLYNSGGNLFWGSSQLGTTGSAGGWTDDGTAIYTTNLTDNVGIGIVNPTAKLQVNTFSGSGSILSLYSGTIRTHYFYSSNGNNARMVMKDASDNDDIVFKTDGHSYFNNAGNVGIGTSSPGNKLHVYDATSGFNDPVAIFESGTNTRIDIRGPGTTQSLGIQFSDPSDPWKGGFGLDESTNNLEFSTNADGSNPRMVIKDNGNVGISTTDPLSLLSVGGDGYSYATITGLNTGGYAVLGETQNGKGVYGLATTTGTGVKGESQNGRGVYGYASGNNGKGVVGHGNVATTSYDFDAIGPGVNYGATSSIRWKKNIVEIDNPLEKLAKLRGVYFDWDNEHGGAHDVGCIAEEVGEVLPEIVVYEENGIDADGMDYSKLTPLLIEVAKAQQEIIEKLENRIKKLETRSKN